MFVAHRNNFRSWVCTPFQILKLWNNLQEIIILLMVYGIFQYMNLASIQQYYSSQISSINRISQKSHVLQQCIMWCFMIYAKWFTNYLDQRPHNVNASSFSLGLIACSWTNYFTLCKISYCCPRYQASAKNCWLNFGAHFPTILSITSPIFSVSILINNLLILILYLSHHSESFHYVYRIWCQRSVVLKAICVVVRR